MIVAIIVGLLAAGGVYLVLQREMLRIALGFALLSHAVNVLLVAAGGTGRRDQPLDGAVDPQTTADPLPQAFVLTAIVIAFAITVYMLALSVVGRRDDDTRDLSDAARSEVVASDDPLDVAEIARAYGAAAPEIHKEPTP
ncbi:cation:proton antiporter [Xylanimonas oleitrophica]|uniref:Cation:proton antiporter n=1 Tax=Xylanimonas oleitrophica TaxID=2607479 RepID=A0A2W5XWQ7_9MICO|nr:cation:proton antiporter subunit C [Xylanimonas oleitrophica]PZR55038.1 cation:proton antiporter [Xylanimonas oleitrophica]